MTSRTRIAVAGAGYIGQAHIDAALHSTTVALSAVVDPSAAARAVAEAHELHNLRMLCGEIAVSARDGLANLRVTEAIVSAAQSGSTIELT